MPVSYEDFSKLEIKIGLVKSAEPVEKSEKLLKLEVDFGNETRQIVAGVGRSYSPADLAGKKFVFVTNIETRKLMGVESRGMMLAAEDVDGRIVAILPEKDIAQGSKVR